MCIGAGQGWGAGNRPTSPATILTAADRAAASAPGRTKTPNGTASGAITGTIPASSGPTRTRAATPTAAPGELSEALKPTKVPGQFSPGGQMPSITLKGVSIKGQSKVAYEEAATAAQSDAQSALSQEKVPRAYQGAVKDYFDDLKK